MARPKKSKPVVKPEPKVDDNGVKIEESVFPPPDPDSFNGTSAANRQYRKFLETNEENEKK
jgi:hypothetical protein